MGKAVFIDRDGVLIELVHHLRNPRDISLIPGAAEAVLMLQEAGYRCVVVTNQSVVGRGMLSLEGLEEIHTALHRHLADAGVTLDGLYFCTANPTIDDETGARHPDRKPNPGMLLRAAKDLDLDLSQSWMIGDMLSDLLAGKNAGCRGSILVETGYGRETEPGHDAVTFRAADLLDAAKRIVAM